MYCCDLCSYRSDDGVVFLKHLFEAHSLESNFSYTCGFNGCRRTFTLGASYDAFRSHCDRKHHNWKESLDSISFDDRESVTDNSSNVAELAEATTRTTATRHPSSSIAALSFDSEEDMDTNRITAVNDSEVICEYDRHEESNLELTAANFVLSLKEKFKLSQVSLNFAIKSVEEIIEMSATNIQHSVVKTLQESDITTNIAHCFTSPSPFANLKTEYQQTRFFKEHFGYIVSYFVNNFCFKILSFILIQVS